jgi:protein-L-isoaspartate O-methyltransferase
MDNTKYIGNELEIFAHATNWKNYYGSLIKPYFGARVLEVGAGIGTTTAVLNNSQTGEWICLEPDMEFVKILHRKIQEGELPGTCHAKQGTVLELDETDLYDCILYIDVLEHIENDFAEAQAAAKHLKPGGKLIILSPAHRWLFTPFDRAIGHYRRYSKETLSRIHPQNCTLEKLAYLDSAGMLLSLANKVMLRQAMPTVKQILFWDRWIVPLSRILDRILMFNLGKSVVGVWKYGA